MLSTPTTSASATARTEGDAAATNNASATACSTTCSLLFSLL